MKITGQIEDLRQKFRFTGDCGEPGAEFDESMLVSCKRFKILFPKI